MSHPLESDAVRMDRHYKWQRFIYDATRTHYLIGRRHLIGELKPMPGDRVLEIGCGTAWNLVRTARRYPQARCYGIDVSNAMLATARASLARHGLAGRVMVCQGDATSFDAEATLGAGAFDRVFFSYALSMIPRWQDALLQAARLVAHGGSLHIVDFGQCDGLPPAFKSAFFAFLRHYAVTPRYELEAQLNAIAASEQFEARFARMHRCYTDYAVLRRLPVPGPTSS